MNRKAMALALTAATAALVAGCGGGADPASDRSDAKPMAAAEASGPAVEIKTFMFEPDPIEVRAGETVTWTNGDDTIHTVTLGSRDEPDAAFDERLSASGGTTSRKFDEPGTYPYHCTLHSGPGMEGEVIVR